VLAWLCRPERRRGLAAQSRHQKPRRHEPRFGARALLFRMAGVDLTVLEGISETTALVILSEIGLDLSRFPTEKNFVSWLGLCPQHRAQRGENLQPRFAWRQSGSAGRCGWRRQGCHHARMRWGRFIADPSTLRRRQAWWRQRGRSRRRVYRLLKYGQEYVRQAEQAYEKRRLRTLKAMARKG